jgi:FAD/FMN-containing dehydrogenase
MTQLSLNTDKTVATVGVGLRWGAVYEFLEGQGLGVVGGRVSTVGVGGLLVGGKLCKLRLYWQWS